MRLRLLLTLLVVVLGVLAGAATATVARVSPAQGRNPFRGARFYVDLHSNAARAEAAYRAAGDTSDARLMARIADHAQAVWIGGWDGRNPAAAVRQVVGRERSAGALPILVAYDIPGRDCGSYSSGGAPTAAAYRRWINGLARGISHHRVVVDVEPDALPELTCWSRAEQRQNVHLIAYAVRTLAAQGATAYIDAGNASWEPAAVMARRLRSADVAQARGFSLNVSNFDTTTASERYGDRLSRLLGGKHFIVDTSRNGRGPAPGDAWCNPPGRGLGRPDTSDTGDPHADALLWIKAPGESDGTCNGGPTSGTWWPQYALGLAANANF